MEISTKPFGYLQRAVRDDIQAAIACQKTLNGRGTLVSDRLSLREMSASLPSSIADVLSLAPEARIQSLFQLTVHSDSIVRGMAWWALAEGWNAHDAPELQRRLLFDHLLHTCNIADVAALDVATSIWLDELVKTVNNVILGQSSIVNSNQFLPDIDRISSAADLINNLVTKTVSPYELLDDSSPEVRLYSLAYLAVHPTAEAQIRDRVLRISQFDPIDSVRLMALKTLSKLDSQDQMTEG